MKTRELLPRHAGLWIVAAASILAAACASEISPTAPSEFGAGEVVARVEGVTVRVRFGEPAGPAASYNRAGEEAVFTIPLGECQPG